MQAQGFLDIYLARISELSFLPLEELSPWLDDEERDHQQRIKAESRLLEFTYSRYLLKELLARYLTLEAKSIRFEKTRYGKLFFKSEHNPIYFNISHTTEAIAIAISDLDEVGVDIEAPFLRQQTDELAIGKRYFTQAEFALLVAEQDPKRRTLAFYQYWTAKESVLKALGTGLSNDLDSVDATKLVSGACNELVISGEAYNPFFQHFSLGDRLQQLAGDCSMPEFLLSAACLSPVQHINLQFALDKIKD